MSWEVIKNTFTTLNTAQSRNNRKRKKKCYQKPQKPLSVKTKKLNHSFKADNLNSDLNKTCQKLYKSDCESDDEINVILADICTNADYNISLPLVGSINTRCIENKRIDSDKKPTYEQNLIRVDQVNLSLSTTENSSIKILQKDNTSNLNDPYMLKNFVITNDVSPLKPINKNHENSLETRNICNDNFRDTLFNMYYIKPIKPNRLCLHKNSLIQSSEITTVENNNLTSEKLKKRKDTDPSGEKGSIKSVNNENKNLMSVVENNTSKKQWLQPTCLSICTKSSKNLKSNKTFIGYNILKENKNDRNQSFNISSKNLIAETKKYSSECVEQNIENELNNFNLQNDQVNMTKAFNSHNYKLVRSTYNRSLSLISQQEINTERNFKKDKMNFNGNAQQFVKDKKEVIDKNKNSSRQQKSKLNDWLKPNQLIFTSLNSNESCRLELNKSIIEDDLSNDNILEDYYKYDFSKEIVVENSQNSTQQSIDNANNNSGIIPCTQKSDLFPKNNELTIEDISSVEYNNTPEYNKKIITQTSTEDDDKISLEGEKELSLLIRDLQYFSKKSKRIKMKKGGFVEKIRNFLKSNRSNYFFWKNEFENECIESGNYGEIIDLYEFFTQTILKISVKSFYISIAVDLNNKIYKGQNFCIGTKVFFEMESFDPLILDNGEKIYLGVNKILKIK